MEALIFISSRSLRSFFPPLRLCVNQLCCDDFEPACYNPARLRFEIAKFRGFGKRKSMRTELRAEGDVAIVDLRGRLVAGEAVDSLHTVVNQLVAEDCKKILLNLSEVDWIDSSGIGELVGSIKLAERFSVVIKLLRIGDRVRHVLSISKLLPVLDVYEDEQEALASFES